MPINTYLETKISSMLKDINCTLKEIKKEMNSTSAINALAELYTMLCQVRSDNMNIFNSIPKFEREYSRLTEDIFRYSETLLGSSPLNLTECRYDSYSEKFEYNPKVVTNNNKKADSFENQELNK